MRYVLFNGQNRNFLLDAAEFSLLKGLQKNQVKELAGFNESKLPFYLYYGRYLLNPDVSHSNICERLKALEGFLLVAIDDTALNCN